MRRHNGSWFILAGLCQRRSYAMPGAVQLSTSPPCISCDPFSGAVPTHLHESEEIDVYHRKPVAIIDFAPSALDM